MPKEVDYSLVATGDWGVVKFALRANRTMPAKQFFDGCSRANQMKLAALFQWLASTGTIPNWEKFHQVEGDIFEFKSHLIRVSCYHDGMCWYLLHGFLKKKRYWSNGDLQHARLIMDENRKLLSQRK